MFTSITCFSPFLTTRLYVLGLSSTLFIFPLPCEYINSCRCISAECSCSIQRAATQSAILSNSPFSITLVHCIRSLTAADPAIPIWRNNKAHRWGGLKRGLLIWASRQQINLTPALWYTIYRLFVMDQWEYTEHGIITNFAGINLQ